MYKLFRIVFFLLFLLMGYESSCAQEQSSSERTLKTFEEWGIPFYADSQVEIIPSGIQKYDELFRAVRDARSFIHLDYFKFQDDSICHALFRLLCEKVRQAVEVRVIFDSFGNQNSVRRLPKSYVDSLQREGVQIVGFDPVRFPWVNHLLHRNHHKIAVIDGEIAYSGGMNVADYYLKGNPRVGEWRDMHMKLYGSVVEGYEQIFEYMWHECTGEQLDSQRYKGRNLSTEKHNIALVNRVPRQSPSSMRDAYICAIDNARELIQIVNPYATFIHSVRTSLYRALERGVKIQIMASFNGDVRVTSDVVAQEMRKLMNRGAEVYYYDGGFHHSKYMTVDNIFCTIGTANLDARSLRYDYEVNAFIFNPEVTNRLQLVFLYDVENKCTRLTPEVWKKRFSPKRRFSGRFFSIIKKVL